MSAKIISGKDLSQQILTKLSEKIKQLEKEGKKPPCLAVVLVGDNPASQIYVRNKKLACKKVGITSLEYTLPNSATQEELINLIQQLNNDNQIDGILVQLPLPTHINSSVVIDNIKPSKDVDGFHRYNMGSLLLSREGCYPCTPHGVMYMLDTVIDDYKGLHAVILGSSNIVGKPMAVELINRDATVTVCNINTKNVPQLVGLADIVVVAVGKAHLVKGEWLKDGCIVIDVGINRLEDGTVCGDVDFETAKHKASYISPVPGGVGPMTIAMLLSNTFALHESA